MSRKCPRSIQVALAFAVTLLLQGAAQGAWTMHSIDNAANNGGLIGADGVKFGDIDGNGLLDIVTGWEGGGKSRIYKHPGYGSVTDIWPSVTACQTATDVEDAAFMDLDSDGWLDVVSSCEGGHNRIYINWGPSNSTDYMDSASWTGGAVDASIGQSYWMYSHPMNVDNEGHMDFVACGKESGYRKICWFKAPANPRVLSGWIMHQIGACNWGMSMFTVDMDNDGDLDVLLSDRDGITWFEYPGPSGAITSLWTANVLYTNDEGTGTVDGEAMVRTPRTMFLDVGDLDQDGLQDIVCALFDKDQETHNYILYMRRLDTGGLNWEKAIYGPWENNWKGIQIADIDCDGSMDIVTTQEAAITTEDIGCYWLKYTGTLPNVTWTLNDIAGAPGIKFDQCRVYDMDNDGDLDVATCEESYDVTGGPANEGLGTFWYENPTDPAATFTLTVAMGTGDGIYPEGTAVNIAADPAPLGQQFIAWTGDTSTIVDVNSQATSMIMPSSDAAISATYTGGTLYSLTVDSGSGDGYYAESVVVPINASPAQAGMMFSQWTGATQHIADPSLPSTTVTMPAEDITVTATYETLVTYTLTVNSGSGDGDYPAHDIVSVAADAPTTGNVFDTWAGDTACVSVVRNQMATLEMPAADATVTATYKAAPAGSESAFIEINGLAIFEAEHYTSKAAGSGTCAGADWTLDTTRTDDSGDCMQALPDTGLNALASTDGARLDFKVYFQNSGDYYVLLRMPVLSGGSNSVSMGMDGSIVTVDIYHTLGDWRWKRALGLLTVTEPGLHTLNVWMREDGVVVDKIIIASDSTYLPIGTDLGPAESDRVPAAPQYTLAVTSGSGDGSYAEGAVVDIAATPAANQTFEEWTGDIAYVANVNSSSTTVTMPAQDISVTAAYLTVPTYALSVTNGSGDGDYMEGAVVDIVADAPGLGRAFVEWTGDTAYVANVNSSSTTVTMPAATVQVAATYANSYPLTVVNGTGSGVYAQGNVVAITATAPPVNMKFSKWTGDTDCIADVSSASTTVTMPAAPVTVTATYQVNYLLTVNSGNGDGRYFPGDIVIISADTAPLHMEFIRWTGDTASVVDVNNATTWVVMPSANVTVTATYDRLPGYYNLTVTSGSGTGLHLWGSTVPIVADPPPPGFGFAGWTGDASYVNEPWSSSATVEMPAMDISVSATYEPSYSLAVNYGTGDGSYLAGEFVVISADTPPDDQVFSEWQGNTQRLVNPRSPDTYLIMPAENVTVTAIFQPIAQLHLLAVVNGHGGGSYSTGTEVPISADPAPYAMNFVKWTGDTTALANVNSADTTVTMPDDDVTVTATYAYPAQDTYSLTVEHGLGGGTYEEGTVVPISADVPLPDYAFVAWTGDTEHVADVDSPNTTVTMPAAAVTVTATYAPIGDLYTLDVTSGSGDGHYEEGAVVEITADTAPVGMTFDRWTGDTEGVADVIAPSTTVTMPAANTTLTATYTALSSYVLEVISGSGSGVYFEGDVVAITADESPTADFLCWIGDTEYLADPSSASTTLTMPGSDASVTATYSTSPLRVTWPSASGISLERGSKTVITWQSSGIDPKTVLVVELKGPSGTWVLANNVKAGKGSMKWDIGKWKSKTGQPVYPDGGNYYIRISTLGGAAEDRSNADFAIGVVTTLEIQGPSEVDENHAVQYSCIASFNYGAPTDYTNVVKWKGLIKSAKLSKTGLLQAREVSADTPGSIMASYGKKETYCEDTLNLSIRNK